MWFFCFFLKISSLIFCYICLVPHGTRLSQSRMIQNENITFVTYNYHIYLITLKLHREKHNNRHTLQFYHTSHLCSGFMGDPKGQAKSLEKCLELLNGPTVRNLAGEWNPFKTCNLRAALLVFAHQVFAADIQNSCLGENSNPGSFCSEPFLFTHRL